MLKGVTGVFMKYYLIICLFMLASPIIQPEELLKDWHYYKNIRISGTNKYKYLFLDRDIYQYSNTSLSDIRIIDDTKNFIPYYIIEGFKEEQTKEKTYKTKQIKKFNEKVKNRTKTNTIYEYQILYNDPDLQVNKLKFLIKNKEEYSIQVIISGRNEKSEWRFLIKDTLYSISEYQKEKINLGNFYNYKFYQIKIMDNLANIGISQLIPVFNKTDKKYDKYKDSMEMEFKQKTEDKETIIHIANQHRLKISSLVFSLEGNFNRRFWLYKGDNEFQAVSGTIYNFQFNDIDISKKSIEIPGTVNREKIKIKINNQDNKPLKINDIQAEYIVDKIIFEDNNKNDLKLYFGNENAKIPVYDIKSFSNYIEKQEMDQCLFDELVVLKEKDPEPKPGNYKILFNIIIAAISILLIVFIPLILKKK